MYWLKHSLPTFVFWVQVPDSPSYLYVAHRRPKLKIRHKRHGRDASVSASKVVLCYNGFNYKGLYGKTTDLF